MRASLDAFLERLSNLESYIQALEFEARLLASAVDNKIPSKLESLVLEFQQHMSGSFTQKRVIDYVSIIISLYGYFEQFVEDVIRGYLRYLNQIIPEYSSLSSAIIKNHVELSFAFINRIKQTRYRGIITEAEIISKLHSCINGGQNYLINIESFVYHTANLRTDVVQHLCTRLGVENLSRRVLAHEAFKNYLQEIHPGIDLSTLREEVAFNYLDDLADRRNEVAHGPPSEILSASILVDYIKYFQVYGQALYEILLSEALKYAVIHHGVLLGTPTDVYKNGTVICLAVENVTLKVGNHIVAQGHDVKDILETGKIQEIQRNDISIKEVKIYSSVEVGIKLDYQTRKNRTFYLLPDEIYQF